MKRSSNIVRLFLKGIIIVILVLCYVISVFLIAVLLIENSMSRGRQRMAHINRYHPYSMTDSARWVSYDPDIYFIVVPNKEISPGVFTEQKPPYGEMITATEDYVEIVVDLIAPYGGGTPRIWICEKEDLDRERALIYGDWWPEEKEIRVTIWEVMDGLIDPSITEIIFVLDENFSSGEPLDW